MTTSGGGKPTWQEIGRSISTAVSDKKRKEVKVDDYYVVVGFEVNKPAAFVNDVHDLAIDYGHAFFYIVKNLLVVKVFSFGPSGAGKVGWFGQGSNEDPNWANAGAVLKDGYQNARPGTPDYGITELVTAFKIKIDHATGLNAVKKTEEMRQKIITGKLKYAAYLNDTCADTARDVLQSAGVKTPEGAGFVKHSGMGVATGTDVDVPVLGKKKIGFSHVNPYMWHKNFKAAGTYPSKAGYLDDKNPAKLLGVADPLFG
jgi:hypothetical protein